MIGTRWLPKPRDFTQTLALLRTHAGSPREVGAAFRHAAEHSLDFTQSCSLERLLQKRLGGMEATELGLRSVRLAWLASSTIAHLIPILRVAALRHGLHLTVHVPPYGQYRQALLAGSGELADFRPDVVLLDIALDQALPSLALDARGPQVEAALRTRVDELRGLWDLARKTHGATVVQQTVLNAAPPLFGSFDAAVPGADRSVLRRLNEEIRRSAAAEGIQLLDLDDVASRGGYDSWFDPVRWHHAKHVVSTDRAPEYADEIARVLSAIRGTSRKCLILDLDNTLWGGVIGDDGLEGIVLGPGSAAGEAFVEFQRYVRRLRERGVILAVCSKNDESVALTPFEKHREMVLKREDISAFVANWKDKATNIRSIAERLNIGIDSLVFYDDNPAERDIVRRELPMVAVPEVPPDPAHYVRDLSAAGYFEAISFTEEDRARGEQYAANEQRDESLRAATDMPTFLRGLEMRARFRAFDEQDLPRVVQLINKTNQFNLTTRRYTQDDVLGLLARPGTLAFSGRLVDRFGDNGLICVVIAVLDAPGEARVDTWLMSCRVLGRGVEEATLQELVRRAADMGATSLCGEYAPTPKNGMVADHYTKLGFEPAASQGDRRFFRLSIRDYRPATHFIHVE
jgi:FkbH-like protein